jgi:undecaprenol kinase
MANNTNTLYHYCMSTFHAALHSHHPLRHAKSFKHAFRGLWHALLHEANFRVQILIVSFSFFLGVHFKITNTEWCLLILSMGSLLAAEMTNTVVEELIDTLIKEYHEGAKIIKDLAAGLVLTTSFTSLAVLVLVFGRRIVSLF